MKRLQAVVIVMCALAVCFAWAGSGRAEALDVLVTIAPQREVVERVAGDRARVTVMVPPGASPHTFEPKPSQMAKTAKADLYISIGVEFERAWLPRFKSANSGLVTAAMDAGIAKLPMPEHGPEEEAHEAEHENEAVEHGHEAEGHHHEGGTPDPHVWLAPELMKAMAANVRDALAAADPAGAAEYAANCAEFIAEAEALRRDIESMFKGVPSRRFLVFHPSWGYFAREFGLIQMPIESGGSEPGPRELVELIREAREHGIRAVFVSPQFSAKGASVVAAELGVGLVKADPLAGDWAANLRATAERLAEAMRGGKE